MFLRLAAPALRKRIQLSAPVSWISGANLEQSFSDYNMISSDKKLETVGRHTFGPRVITGASKAHENLKQETGT